MKTLVIFIHGLGGSEKTWEQFLGLAREDSELNERFVFEPFVYETSVFGFGASLAEIAALLRSDLNSKYRDFPEVILISHSQGGLVAEKYLVEEVKSGQPLRVVLLMTYAMPRAGSLLARFAPGTQTKQLRSDSDFMRYLNSDWETLEMARRLKLVRVDGTDDAVISRPGLAEFDSRTVTKARGGHTKVVRPESRETDSYIHFKQALIEIRPTAEVVPPSAPQSGLREVEVAPQQVPSSVPAPAATSDLRKSLMILPFEDLSPTHDNDWFADGIAAELINVLSGLKKLRVADQEATRNYKRYVGALPNYAHEMSIRYFVQGSVRKFGDQIKIAVTLLDIETGDHLWQDSLKGTMEDIFDIQETVATKVVEGLQVLLAPAEQKRLSEHGTDNAEAYEFYLQARQYFDQQTREGFVLAIRLHTEALRLDPDYADACANKALALAFLYRDYDQDPALLEEGARLVGGVLATKPDHWLAFGALSHILRLQGKLDEAEAAAKSAIRIAPDEFGSHFVLGFFYAETGQNDRAIAPFEEAARRRPDNLATLFNLVLRFNLAGNIAKRVEWATVAIPVFERSLKLFPNDENNRVFHALLLHYADRDDEARSAARGLGDLRDGNALFNAACLQCELGDLEGGIRSVRRSMEVGFRGHRVLREFLDDEKEGVGRLKGTPEHEDLRRLIEELA